MTGRGRMLVRSRIALITGCVVAVAIAAISTVTWVTTRHNLRAQLDESLLVGLPPSAVQPPPIAPEPDFGLLCTANPANEELQRFLRGAQLIRTDGTICAPAGVDQVVTDPHDRQVTATTLREGRTRSGTPVRLVLHPLQDGDVLVVSRSLTEIDETLHTLAEVLVVVSVLGALLVAAAGQLLTRRALTPMRRLTEIDAQLGRVGRHVGDVG
ncbi:histidine kinase, partial [Actinosynnema sp. NPDC023658]